MAAFNDTIPERIKVDPLPLTAPPGRIIVKPTFFRNIGKVQLADIGKKISFYGTVVALPDDLWERIKIADLLMFHPVDRTDIVFQNENYYVIKIEDVCAVIDAL
jgi:hypothetical protein